ncbi:MAG: hypothetical protein WCJ30_25210 [Deltaproteobacteria bacterium]
MIPDSVLISYGLLAGGARLVVPPVMDLPFVRAIRGAMFDRLTREAGVTLSAEARRVLVDFEAPTSKRGATEQAIRWAAGRFVPMAGTVDAVRNILRTYAAGVLFRRYLDEHRSTPRDPVLNGLEAARVQKAMLLAIDAAAMDHVQAISKMAVDAMRNPHAASDAGFVQKYSDALVSTVAELPMSWMEVLDRDFVKALG